MRYTEAKEDEVRQRGSSPLVVDKERLSLKQRAYLYWGREFQTDGKFSLTNDLKSVCNMYLCMCVRMDGPISDCRPHPAKVHAPFAHLFVHRCV